MSERMLTDKITMRPYGDDGWAFSDDGCGCGAGGLAVMQTGGEPFAVEQHIAGCGDDDLPARVIVAIAARVAELEAENARLRKCVAEARLAMMEPHGEWKDVREAKALNMIRAEVDK